MNLYEAEQLAGIEINKWLTNLSWSFKWNNRKTAFGVCNYRDQTIQLSKFLTQSQPESEVLDTIRHEIAHALSGSGNGHNHIWKRYCRLVGSNGKRTSKGHKIEREDRGYKWAMVDEKGKFVKGYHRRPNRNTFLSVHNMYLPARKYETLGKLKIVQMSRVL